MRAGECDAFQVGVRIDLGSEQVVARHQVARGRGFGAEAQRVALQVFQLVDALVGGDEDRLEFLVLVALYQRDDGALAAVLGLHEGEAAEPDHVNLVVDQRFHRSGVVGHRGELDLHAGLVLQVFAQRLELALQFGRCFVRNGRHAQYTGRRLRGGVRGGQHHTGGEGGG